MVRIIKADVKSDAINKLGYYENIKRLFKRTHINY